MDKSVFIFLPVSFYFSLLIKKIEIDRVRAIKKSTHGQKLKNVEKFGGCVEVRKIKIYINQLDRKRLHGYTGFGVRL
ncbi:hypothetical protein [Cellvibrio japonicus]|uniref:hypothetical protein n=1 Tax=Cellvibrio japonicus TaxID=155077 RepID=UPI0011D0A7E3|nr:hypothetical protein [Cellvibrio japonicus]QEI13668.1 hypothetical protein FY117_16585 [Cellvibrio japonicus]QEI17242.1 hypothetical protein FY116_16590 [Cellvibrio japonicus]QEI20819.1 hypothetical protein FY115_16585 [Cellvibrio japonicus]